MTNQEILAAGNGAFNAGNHDQAIEILGRINTQDANSYAAALLLMGRAFMRKNDLDQAKVCIEESYNVRKNARTLFHLGECLYQLGDKDSALECLTMSTASDESLTDAFIMKGVVLKDLGRTKEAIPCFDRALKNDPKAVVARYQIAQITFDLGDLQRAAAQAHHVIQHAKDFAPAHLLMANIATKLGDYRQAAVELCQVLELGGPDSAVYLSLGRAFAHLQDIPQALAAFEAAFQIDSDNELACSAIARLADRIGDTDKAGLYYRHLLRFEGSKQLAVEALARMGIPADPPPKIEKVKGKKGKSGNPKNAPAVRFQPPKMIDRTGLPAALPNRHTGRVIGDGNRGTQPLRPPVGPNGPARGTSALPQGIPLPGRGAAPTTPLDNLLGNINRLLDQTPLKGRIDAQALGHSVNAKANELVNRLKNEVISRVKKGTGDLPPSPSRLPARPAGNKPAGPGGPNRPSSPPSSPPKRKS